MQPLSKYDVLNKNMKKFSKIIVSFISSYALALTPKKKNAVIEKTMENFLCDAYILLEMKNDISKYLAINVHDINMYDFYETLNKTSNQLEKILILYVICKKKSDDFIYKIIIDFINKNKTKEEIISFMYSNLDEADKEILNIINSDDYSFDKLPQTYKDIVINDHNDFMDYKINIYINKIESEKIELLKSIKIYEENVDIDLSTKFNSNQKIKRT